MYLWSGWVLAGLIFIRFFRSFLVFNPTSMYLGYAWNLGSLLGILLVIQVFTGVLLALYYTPESSLAFDSVQYICREVPFGWVLRVVHFNGASMLFLCLYLHLIKGLLLSSYRLKGVWVSGFIMLFFFIAIAFTGYVLSWSQMSYWAAVVITSLLSTLPILGSSLLIWVWGGFSVGSATLKLFFVTHFLLPWLLFLLVFFHLIFLHDSGSTSNLGYSGCLGKTLFFPYYWVQDVLNLFVLLVIFIFLLFYPYLLGDPEIFVEADPLVSPLHIVPEWYFTPFYAILRVVPSKGLGVFFLFFSLLLPMSFCLFSNYIGPLILFIRFLCYWFFIVVVVLGWLGQSAIEHPYTYLGGVFTVLYFVLLFSILLVFVLPHYLYSPYVVISTLIS